MQSRYFLSQRIAKYQEERRLQLQHRQSLAYKEFRKVKVDCSFRPDSRWGMLGRDPAWLLYMDFQISQPEDCALTNATVEVTFQQAESDDPNSVFKSGPIVTEHFGPRNIDSEVIAVYGDMPCNEGPELIHQGSSHEKARQTDNHNIPWTFRGFSWPVHGDDTGLRRRAEWRLTHANYCSSFRLGLVLQHEMEPFWIEVTIDGKLQSQNSRLYRFRRWASREDGVARKVIPSEDCQFSLDEIAAKLDESLTSVNIKNYYQNRRIPRLPKENTSMNDTSVCAKHPNVPTAPSRTGDHHRHSDYTVAWICALPEEMAPAEAMLDKMHERVPLPSADENQYVLGEMGGHYIVLVCLPHGSYGTTSAAVVATHLRTTFKNIKFGLMVGIAGGVPSGQNDIRLGDVVVSNPIGQFGGVVKYDFGRRIGAHVKPDGTLNKPPQSLLTATAILRTKHLISGKEDSPHIEDMLTKYPHMQERFSNPGKSHDLLFQSGYEHTGAPGTCESCDIDQQIQRAPRSNAGPRIHYGLIGSGNQLMRNSNERDRLAQELGILCFEMEAAGLMDTFPCLAVRGISDYADSHKNDRWQGWAAATASGYAKDLLLVISPQM